MKSLAFKYGLSFHSEQALKFRDFYLFKYQKNERETNHIEGNYKNHQIHIYDKVLFFNFGLRTIVVVDGDVIFGKLNFNFSDYLFNSLLLNLFSDYSTKKIESILKDKIE